MSRMQGMATLVLPARAELGESALWDHRIQRLWWVDILGGQLHCFDPESAADESFEMGELCAAVALDKQGDVLVALKDSIKRFRRGTKQLESLAQMEHATLSIRFNEGRSDPAGRFWVGTLAIGADAGRGALYCLEKDLSLSRKLKGLSISNGMAWNRVADRMYYIDSSTQRILEFQYDRASASISGPRLAASFDPKEGSPDGMCADSDDMLWVALWGAGKVVRLDPRRDERLAEIVIPGALQASSCSLGGGDLKTLLITSAREHLEASALEAQPNAGALFSFRVDCPGLNAIPFGDT